MQTDSISKKIATSFGLGYVSTFPGTMASFLILFPLWFIKDNINNYYFLLLILLLSICSLLIIKKAISNSQDKDPKCIIIDEYIGQSFAIMFVDQQITQYFLAFLFFRVFDIFKPFPINLIDSFKNEYGVLFDDILAGIYSGIIVILLSRWI